jgi:PiT family inorganic phosphate transporter
MNSLMSSTQQFGEGVNWGKVQETAMALIVSPVIGFFAAAALLLVAKYVITNPALYQAPEGNKPPPMWIRAILVLTCTGVSFAHGSNDGQKGMGLIMLILIGIVPATYALNLATSSDRIQTIIAASQAAQPVLGPSVAATDTMANSVADAELSRFLTTGKPTPQTQSALALKNSLVAAQLGKIKSINELSVEGRSRLRRDVYLVEEGVNKLLKSGAVTDAKNKTILSKLRSELQSLTDSSARPSAGSASW